MNRTPLFLPKTLNVSSNQKMLLTRNVRLAHLPLPDAPCPPGRELIVSGWGTVAIWLGQTIVEERENRFLWAVKQECVNVNECDAYKGDKDALLCTTALSDSRNTATSGDSGGISLIKSVVSIYYSFGNINSHVIIFNLITSKVH